MPKVGIALGGGGAKGLAHVTALQVLEEAGVRPACIAGTSIGAIAGAASAAGLPAATVRQELLDIVHDERSLIPRLGWLDLIRPGWGKAGLLDAGRFLDHLFERIGVTTFEALEIPLRVVATDFWSREVVVLDSGDLRSAVQASMSVPGVFEPVKRDGRVLVDGGCVNPVPFDLLDPDCDVTIAVDVLGKRDAEPEELPSVVDAVFQAYSIMEHSITREKVKRKPPTLYLEPDIRDVRLLEFHKADRVLEQADARKADWRSALDAAIA